MLRDPQCSRSNKTLPHPHPVQQARPTNNPESSHNITRAREEPMNTAIAIQSIAESRNRGAASILSRAHVPDRYEITSIVRRAQQGDAQAREAAVLALAPYAHTIATRYYHLWRSKIPNSLHYDDVYASALEGIAWSIDDYDTEGANSFAGFATPRITTKVQRCIYRSAGIVRIPETHMYTIDPEHPLMATQAYGIDASAPGSDNNKRIHDMMPDPDACAGYDHVDAADAHRDLVAILTQIDERLPRIAQLLADGVTQARVSLDLGIPQRTITDMLATARTRITEAALV